MKLIVSTERNGIMSIRNYFWLELFVWAMKLPARLSNPICDKIADMLEFDDSGDLAI
jgi:hypothetical protein